MPRRSAHPLLALVLALLTAILLVNLIQTSFEKLGVRPALVPFILLASLVGSVINVPLWHRPI